MHPREYLKICDEQYAIILASQEAIQKAYELAAGYPLPLKLRPAIPSDIVTGAILWYPDHDEGHPHWRVVEEVLRSNDDFKAYMYDGCRYGLHGAFVEIESVVE